MLLQSPQFCYGLWLHPETLDGALLYLCIQCVKKADCTWLPNGVLWKKARVAAGAETNKTTSGTPTNIQPRQQRDKQAKVA